MKVFLKENVPFFCKIITLSFDCYFFFKNKYNNQYSSKLNSVKRDLPFAKITYLQFINFMFFPSKKVTLGPIMGLYVLYNIIGKVSFSPDFGGYQLSVKKKRKNLFKR